MSFKLGAAMTGALLALPLYAQAQQSRSPADPADPGVAVPPIVYESVIAGNARTPANQVTPDKFWRAANDALTGAPGPAHGHAAGSHDHHAPTPPAPPVKPAAPPPADHSKHH